MDLNSKIGQDVSAKIQLGIWASPSLTGTLLKTLYPGDSIGKISGVQMVGTDPWFTLQGGGYIHAIDSNLVFPGSSSSSSAIKWIIGLLVAGGVGYGIYRKKKKKSAK